MRILIILFSFIPTLVQAALWNDLSGIVSAENISDIRLTPIIKKIANAEELTTNEQQIYAEEHARLEHARLDFLNSYYNSNQSTQDKVANTINQLDDKRQLWFADVLPQIQQMQLDTNQTQPKKINSKNELIEVNLNDTTEINGSNFPVNTFALTFDDGPLYITTPKILDILDKFNIKATFCQVGSVLTDTMVTHPNLDIENRIVQAEHYLCNHSWNHPEFTKLTIQSAAKQIDDTQNAIEKYSNMAPMLFRFPYGARDNQLKQMVHATRLLSVMWNIDSLDWKLKDPQDIINLVKSQVEKRKQGIILMHDIHTQTVAALPGIIDLLLNREATFLRIHALDNASGIE